MPDAHAKVDPNDPFFLRLRRLRDDAGTPTYREIAENAGMSVSTANNVLRGHNLPRWDLVRSLLAALGGDSEEIRPLYEQMIVRARARRAGQPFPAAAVACPGCGCYIASEVLHADACNGGPRRPRIELSIAPPIALDSWLQREDYADFRSGYAYAAASTNAIPGLAKIDPEEAYYIWWFINRGMRLHHTGRNLALDGITECGDYPAPCNCDDPETHNGH